MDITKLAILKKLSGGGVPNITEPVIVNITNTNGTLTADKTVIEIKQAALAGKTVYAYEPINGATGMMVYTLSLALDNRGHDTAFFYSRQNRWVEELFVTTDNGATTVNRRKYENVNQGEADGLILQSSTLGSTKKFRIAVDDTGSISATEVT